MDNLPVSQILTVLVLALLVLGLLNLTNWVNKRWEFGLPFVRLPKPMDEGKEDLTLTGITLDRLDDRGKLLRRFDQFRRDVDNSKAMEGFDAFTQQAFGILTSSQLSEALDLDKENPKVRERYGKGTGKHQGDGAPRLNEQFLLARRLVEAGVRLRAL